MLSLPVKAARGITVLLSTLALLACSKPSTNTDGAANIILIIGDGMDEQQLTIARNYLVGSKDKLIVDSLPKLATVRVQTVSAEDPARFVYVADSANTATTLATGQLSSKGRISRDASGLKSLATIIEQAQAAGYRSGIVTTANVTDATPAAFASHSVHRKCQGPQDLVAATRWFLTEIDCTAESVANGGPGSIANQLAHAKLDVLLGGGATVFHQAGFGGEQSPVASAGASGFTLATNPQELADAPLDTPLLGLFAANHLPVQMIGERQRKAEAVILEENKPPIAAEVFSCVDNPAAQETPSLKAMTDAALARLGNDPKRGFFLMIESASIDKQSHVRQPCGHIGEVEQLQQALQSAIDFADTHPNTLILVTADHGHAAQIVPDQEQFIYGEHAVHSPGFVARVQTPEGSVMMINYATSNIMEMHTGTNVPLFASGPGTEAIPSYLTQADIYNLMKNFLDL